LQVGNTHATRRAILFKNLNYILREIYDILSEDALNYSVYYIGTGFVVRRNVYTLHTSVIKSWEKAKEFCAEQKGKQLAIIPSSGEERQEFFDKLDAFCGQYNMCLVISLRLYSYICIPTPVSLHLCSYTCIFTPVSLHLCPYTCIPTPVSLHLYPYTCISTPVSLHLYLYTCISTPLSLHLYLYTCISTPVSLHLFLITPASLHTILLHRCPLKLRSYLC